jgi:riboflavin kinase/FMN adenylyltransferase
LKSCFTLKSSITSIAIGGFDGMHLAHQELFSRLDTNGSILVIETGYANLTPENHREKYANFPFYYYSLENIKHLSPKEFVELLKEEYPKLSKIIIGFDFKFGSNASGSIGDLKSLFDGEIEIVDEFFYEDIAVHSRVIRELLLCGDIKKANQLLGRNYEIYGHHIDGQGLGKKQFVPTINVRCNDFLTPKEGIYSSFTIVDNVKYLSVTFIGNRLSTDGHFAIETHLINKTLNEIHSPIIIEFTDKIRDNKKYDDLVELKKQILLDIDTVLKQN